MGEEKIQLPFCPGEQFLLETDQIFMVFFIDRQHFTGLLRETGDHIGNDLCRKSVNRGIIKDLLAVFLSDHMVPVVSLDMQASFMCEVKDITDLLKGNAFPVKTFLGCTVIDFSAVKADDVTALSVEMESTGLRSGPGKRPAGADDDLVPGFDRFPDRVLVFFCQFFGICQERSVQISEKDHFFLASRKFVRIS